jgi:hypothetical protein
VEELSEDPKTDEDLIMRYEELRMRALSQVDRSEGGLGWAMFVRKGMVAWLRAWREHNPSPACPQTKAEPNGVTTTAAEHNEIVKVWTSMILGQLPGRMICL